MINVTKSAPPAVLNKTRDAIKNALKSHHEDWLAGNKTEFKSSIYAHESVKSQLIKDQLEKCAFCESKFLSTGYGDVEHFRPKAGYKQNPNEPIRKPGYYWLAYDWSNLSLSCSLCNQRHKGNSFPLSQQRYRAKSPTDDLTKESPLLIDPCSEDPTAFISFRDNVAFPLNGSNRGKTTIEILGLNRPNTQEDRGEYLGLIKKLFSMVQLAKKCMDSDVTLLAAECEKELRRRAKRSAEYSSMVRCYLDSVGFSY